MAKGYELQNSIREFIRLGLTKDQMKSKLLKEHKDQIDEVLVNESVDRVCEDYPDFELIQFFMKAKIVSNMDGEDNILYLFDPVSYEVKTIDKIRLNEMIHPKLKWSHRRYTSKFIYDPINPFKLKKEHGQSYFNVYQPPAWKHEYFFSGGTTPIPKRDKLPEIYRIFFEHLTNADKKSIKYTLDWMANMLQGRNYCILTTIGNQGIGKGVLGEIMKKLVGASNFQLTDKKLITKDFNGQIANKRLVYLDEIKVKGTDQENKVKSLINDHIEIEAKGKDAKMVRNYGSFYFSSNNIDSVPLSEDDRRFSVIELTMKKLIEVMTGEQIEALLKDENIAELGEYLSHREINQDEMLKVFRSKRFEQLRSEALNDWQEWFLEDFIPDNENKSFSIEDIKVEVNKQFGDQYTKLGRPALSSLSRRFPSHFSLLKKVDPDNKKKRPWRVVIHEVPELSEIGGRVS